MTYDESLSFDSDHPEPATSPTADLLDTLALYGHRPPQDEPDSSWADYQYSVPWPLVMALQVTRG